MATVLGSPAIDLYTLYEICTCIIHYASACNNSGVMDQLHVVSTPPYKFQKLHLTPAAMMKWTSLSVLKTQPFSMASAQPCGCLLDSLSFVAIRDISPH